jgi:diacylglycerol O-acyltransferase 1
LIFPALAPPSTFASPKALLTLLSWAFTLSSTYLIEKIVVIYRIKSEDTLLIVNFVNGVISLVFPCLWAWKSGSNPLFTMIYLFNSVILFMKVVSYSHANRDLRKVFYSSMKEVEDRIANKEKQLGHKGNKDSRILHQISTSSHDDNGKPYSTNIFTEASNLEAPYVQYPDNITVQNLLFFVLVPSLTYQLNYPRSLKVRKRYVVTLLLRMLMVMMLITLTYNQYIRPVLNTPTVRALNVPEMIEKVLTLSIPNTYIWLLGFYFYFHLYLNLFAELTRFGDREFYRGACVNYVSFHLRSYFTVS